MLEEALAQTSPKKKKERGVIAGVAVEYVGASEKRKLTIILNKLKKIPTGRKTLENMAEYGTIVSLAPLMGAYGGFGSGRIFLNSQVKTDNLCSTLVHEARHATQHQRMENMGLTHDGKDTIREDCDLETQIRLDRAMEADAQSFAHQATLELKQAGDIKPWQEFNHATPQMINSYHFAQMQEDFQDGTDEAFSASFRAFFDDKKRVAIYEDVYMGNAALLDFTKSMTEGKVFAGKRNVHLTTEQIAAVTCGEYMADYDAFLNSDKAMGVTKKTKDVLVMTSTALGKDFNADKLPLSSEGVSFSDANSIATSSVGDIRKGSFKVLTKVTGLETRQEIEALYNDSVEKQAETVKGFDEEARAAFRRGKIAEKLVCYFNNLESISSAKLGLKSNNEEKKQAAQKIFDEKTAQNADLRDYVTVAAFIETNRKGNSELVNRAMALPELSESVKKELRFDNTVLARPSEQKALPLSEKEEASLKALRKGLSRPVKEPAQMKVTQILAARATQR